MIDVEISTALLLYLGFILLVFFACWVASHMRGRKKSPLPPEAHLEKCEYCLYPYLATTGEKLTKCPQCGSINRHG